MRRFKERRLEELRQILTCLYVDDKLLRINRLLVMFVIVFLASSLSIDIYLLCDRGDVLPFLGSVHNFPIRMTTKVGPHK